MIKEGSPVIYVDPVGVEHAALVTNCFGPDGQIDPAIPDQLKYAINLVWVEDDESKRDSYGRQIARNTSISGQSEYTAHGNYWKPVAA
jgi:hypothetical protein